MNTTFALTTTIVAAAYTQTDTPTIMKLNANAFTYSNYELRAPAARLRHAPRGQRAERKAARRAHPHGF